MGFGDFLGNTLGGFIQPFAQGAGLYNNNTAQNPMIHQQDFANAIQQSQGTQEQLAQALLAQSQGQGPNIAQEQLNQATNANIAQQAGAIASARGINPALATRLAANQGANLQQQAAGQSGIMRAQQQLAAQQQLGQNNLTYQQILQQAQANQNNAINQGALGAAGINAGIGQQNAAMNGKILGGIFQGVSGLQGLGGAGGAGAGGAAGGGAAMAGGGEGLGSAAMMVASQGGYVPGQAEVSGDSQQNDKVHALLSPGEIVVPRSAASNADTAKAFIDQLKGGGKKKYTDVLEAQRNLDKATAAYQKFVDGGEVQGPESLQPGFNWIPQSSQSTAPMSPVSQGPSPVPEQTAQPTQQSVEGQPALNVPGVTMPKELQNIYGEQMKGVQGTAAAQQNQAKGAEQAYGEYEKNIANTIQTSEAKKQELLNDYNKKLQDYTSGKIDPDRLWHSAGTGQKVSAAVGIILGGIGSALTGGSNPALSLINSQIDRDIDAQKADMGKKQNLLTMNMQQYKNQQDAEAKTKIDYLTALQAKLAITAAKSGNTQAMANQHLANAEIQKEIYNQGTQIAHRQALQQLAGGNSTGLNAESLLPEERERLVTLPSGNKAIAPTKEEATNTNDALSTLNELESAVQRAQDFAKEHTGVAGMTYGAHVPGLGEVGSDNYKAGMAIKHDIETSMNKLQGLNRLNDVEMKKFEEMVADPGSLSGGKVQKLNDFLRTKIAEKKDLIQQQYVEGHKTGQANKYQQQMGKPVIK